MYLIQLIKNIKLMAGLNCISCVKKNKSDLQLERNNRQAIKTIDELFRNFLEINKIQSLYE